MQPLDKDLQSKKHSIQDFIEITKKVLNYLPNVITGYKEKHPYRIYISDIKGTTQYLRPININLFTFDVDQFCSNSNELLMTLEKIKNRNLSFSTLEKENINSTLYTIQQSIGAGFDLLVNANSARKHVGNRFEELTRSIFTAIGIANKHAVLQIPYETDEGQKMYKCENDIILSPYPNIISTTKHIDEREIVVSSKTTSKDRMGKMFMDKILLERFVGHKQKVIGIFLNDVQRKESDNISYTLVSGLFMVYSKFITELEGIYYLDPPPNALRPPYNRHMKKFSDLITEDIFKLLSS